VNPTEVDPAVQKVLRSLEKQQRRPDFQDYKARFLNFAGDQCIRAAMHERGATYYGLSINTFLGADRFDAASAICRKLVRVLPHVVRARCTLTWLAMAKGLSAEAQQFVREYAQAADTAGTEKLASRHVRSMVEMTEDAELCWTLGDVLLWLGDDVGADRSFGIAHELRARPRRLETEPERVIQIRRILLEGFTAGDGALAA
jgi:hypothetical protein